MLRVVMFAVGVCLGASSVAKADTPADQTRPSLDASDAATNIEFVALVEKAERARLAGRFVEAALAYEAALKKQPDPVISGRYGLVLMKLGHAASAAQALHEAFEHGQRASAQERRDIAVAYDKAKASTTWVNVDVSQLGATIIYDGSPLGRDGSASFWMFAMPGEHTLRAQLDGYEEAAATFTGKPGEEITVTLRLLPNPNIRPSDQSERTLETLLHKKRRFPPPFHGSNIPGDPDYNAKEDPTYGEPKETKPPEKKSGPRFSVMGGVVTVFGVASWNPAVGGVVGIGFRPHENFSIGLEGRAAWLTTGVGDGQISAMTAGGLASLCGHVKWFFACPLGHLGVIRTEGAKSTFSEPPFNIFRPGFGGRLGVRFRPTEQLRLQATAEALALTNRIRIFVGNEMIVDQPAVMIGTQITGEWEF